MKYYTAKTIVKGYKICSHLRGLNLVAIPYRATRQNHVIVTNKKIKMLITNQSRVLHKEMFRDKFIKNRHYVLYYYEWLPNHKQMTLFP